MKYFTLRLISIFIAFQAGFFARAQNEVHSVKVELDWQSDLNLFPGHSLLVFEGSVNHDSLGFLPVFHYLMPEHPSRILTDAVIRNEISEPFEIECPVNYPDLEKIGSKPILIIANLASRRSTIPAVYVMPVYRDESGSYRRLTSFTLEVSLSTKNEPNRETDAREYAAYSVLREGDWFRIAVRQTGVHILTYQDLVDMGFNPGQSDPRKISLFGNGNGMLPEPNSMDRPDDLTENAIFVAGEEDGRFDPDDYILFFGLAAVKVYFNNFYDYFEHEVNFYTDETYYFLTQRPVNGKRIQEESAIYTEPTHEVTTFQDFVYYEKEAVNLIKSGKIWYGEVFDQKLDYTFPFHLPGKVNEEPVILKLSLAGRTTSRTNFEVMVSDQLQMELDVPSIVLNSQIYGRPILSGFEPFYTSNDSAVIRIIYNKTGTIDKGWLNYIELNYIRNLEHTGNQLLFRDMRIVGDSVVARYHLSGAAPGTTVWDITDPAMVLNIPVTAESNGVTITTSADSGREFVAFSPGAYYSPEFVERVENQDLHAMGSADYIIVAHPLFLEQANRLADFHRQYSGMQVHIVTPRQIYNEFSSGAQDVSAIRDFVKMIYDRAGDGEEPRYLLLFGDASYDYKRFLEIDNNFVPAYQSRESLKAAASFVTDDFFGCMDIDEGSNGSGTMDLGVGRFPVHTLEQAKAMVDKTIQYMSPVRENFGPWRNSICFIGDDEDNNTHFGQAEGLVKIADSLGPAYNVNKIYLDAYSQLKTPSGNRYPDVNKAIDQVVGEGALIVNYTGHGGEIAWAEERILDIPAIQSYTNLNSLPTFVTATCEFSRYDDPGLVSAGELVFLNPEGAGIGLFTTTRLAFSQSNYALNKRFYYESFIIDPLTGEYPRQGDLIRVAKTPSNQNIKNFVLLGDPALMLAYPKMKVSALNVLNERSGRMTDTISAQSKVTIEGQVEDLQGNRLEGFNGTVHVTVFDKPVLYTTRANDPSSKVADFYMQDKKIFRGEASVANGLFSFSFIVPVDISYQFGDGKISYYALDTNNLIDAQGYDHIIVGGQDELAITDDKGPDISLYLNVLSFESGDITTSSPTLIVKLFDESGINTVGNGIGHDISAVVDGNNREPIILNDYFTPATDSYQSGEILYRIGPFADGLHTLTLKAWDVMNNSSESTITFIINTSNRLFLGNLEARPNPFRDQVFFHFGHNKPGASMDVTISIFNLSGLFIHELRYAIQPESADSGPLYWNGRDSSGNELLPGLYVYRLKVRSDDGYESILSEKFFRIR